MKDDLMSTPATGLVPRAVRERSLAPTSAAQGTAVPSAGSRAATAHAFDLPGLPLRAAPV